MSARESFGQCPPRACKGLRSLLGVLGALALVLALDALRGLSAGRLAVSDAAVTLELKAAPAAPAAPPASAAAPTLAAAAQATAAPAATAESAALEPVPCRAGAAAGSKLAKVERLDPLAPLGEQVSRVCALGLEAWSLSSGSAAARALVAAPRQRFWWPRLRPDRFCDLNLRTWHGEYGNGAAMQRVCDAAAQQGGPPRGPVLAAPLFPLPPPERPLLARVRDAVVSYEGVVQPVGSGVRVQGLHCCYCFTELHFKDSERARACATALSVESAAARAAGGVLAACELPQLGQVMVLSSVFGGEPAHVFKEVLPRLAPWLPWLRANPHVALHLKSKRGRSGPANFTFEALRLLGLLGPDRVVVAGDVVAREAWLPPSSTCGQVADQFWGARRVRDELLRAALPPARAQEHGQGQPRERVVVLIERHASDHRTWGDPARYRQAREAVHAAADPAGARVVLFSDIDDKLMACLVCQISIFGSADAVVGQHGAGLTHAMFMRPGGSKPIDRPRHPAAVH